MLKRDVSNNSMDLEYERYLSSYEWTMSGAYVLFPYPNESKYFYGFLSNHMPDWKERTTFLDQDVVHGL